MNTRWFIAVIGLIAWCKLAPAQVIEGRVDLPRAKDDAPMAARYQTVTNSAASAEPAVAVVYLEGDHLKPEANAGAKVVEMEQKNIAFSPGILAVKVGTTVEFPNLDDTYHNVFSYSKTKRFDLGRYRKGEKPGSVLFDKPGVVTLHCEIHASMRGTILILDTPYFQKTDALGAYHIGSLPAGHYLLKAWISDNDIRVQPVDIKAGATLHVDLARK